MRWWSAALVFCGCTCDPAALNGTALRIRVNIDEQVTVTQVRFSATLDGGTVFAPVVRPEAAGDRLASGGSLLVLLPDALDGQTVMCVAAGLFQSAVVSADLQPAKVQRGIEVSCTVSLQPSLSCDATSCSGCCAGNICLGGGDKGACGSGGEPCTPCGDGQRCAQGACLCDSASCSGCCSGVTCLDGGADLACGKNGTMCSSCPAGQACSGGACACDGGPCGTGCTATSCTGGCCSAGACIMLTALTCAAPGSGLSCVDCRSAQADSCTPQGRCVCGNRNTPCPATQHCVGGECICDHTVCAGCCQGQVCNAGTTKQRCGIDGGVCRSCSNGLTCTAGTCQ